MLLKLRLELLLLLLQKIDAAKSKTHHICSHHVGKHIGEVKGWHLVMMSTGCCTELLEALQLGLRLSKISSKSTITLDTTNTSV